MNKSFALKEGGLHKKDKQINIVLQIYQKAFLKVHESLKFKILLSLVCSFVIVVVCFEQIKVFASIAFRTKFHNFFFCNFVLMLPIWNVKH